MMPSATPGSHPRLCIVAPCYNEQEVIEQFYRQLRGVLETMADVEPVIVFVDDGSSDATLKVLNQIAMDDQRVRVFSLSRNFGHQIALSAGLDVASGDAIVLMDSDLQHPPKLIPSMVVLWREGYDIVSTVRKTTQRTGMLKRISAAGFYYLINLLSDTKIVPGAADFCLLSRRAHEALVAMPERHRFLRGMVSWIGFSRAFVSFEAPARGAGESKYSLYKMISLALDAVFSFSTTPVRLATRGGLAITGCALAYLLYILGRYLIAGDLVPGWGSLICTVLIVGGVQLCFIGMMGQYLARVYEETKSRPLYFFKQTYPPDSGRKRQALSEEECQTPAPRF